jgi:hypothetical protein
MHTQRPNHANPVALLLQSTPPAGRVPELGSLGGMSALATEVDVSGSAIMAPINQPK